MLNPFVFFPLFLYLGIYAFKYGQFYDEHGRRPSFSELRRVKPKDKVTRRNMRALRIGMVFFLCLYVLFIPFFGSIEEQVADKEAMVVFFKSLCLMILAINFMGRSAIYKEAGFEPPKAANSYYPLYDIFKKTGWFVSGTDWVVRAINISTVFGLVLFIYIIFI